MIMGEYLVQQAIQEGFDLMRQQPALINEVFGSLTEAIREQISSWFAANTVPVIMGFPVEGARSPCVGITLGDEIEREDRQPIGSEAYREDEAGKWYTHTFFNTVYQITVYAPNADLVIWLQTLVKWSLLFNRPWLELQGLSEQTIQASDFLPALEFLPDYVFARGVRLKAVHLDGVSQQAVEQVKRIEVSVTPYVPCTAVVETEGTGDEEPGEDDEEPGEDDEEPGEDDEE